MREQGLSWGGGGGGGERDMSHQANQEVFSFFFVRKGRRTFQVLVGYLAVGSGHFSVDKVLRITDVQLWRFQISLQHCQLCHLLLPAITFTCTNL